MRTTNQVITHWKGDMAFESSNPSGISLTMDASEDDGGKGDGYRPKALMLSSLAGCSGLDIAMLIRKMKLKVDDFRIDITGTLTEEHPKYYDKVLVEYHFFGDQLEEKKLLRAVDLSVTKYCGVMEMFRRFCEMQIETIFHPRS